PSRGRQLGHHVVQLYELQYCAPDSFFRIALVKDSPAIVGRLEDHAQDRPIRRRDTPVDVRGAVSIELCFQKIGMVAHDLDGLLRHAYPEGPSQDGLRARVKVRPLALRSTPPSHIRLRPGRWLSRLLALSPIGHVSSGVDKVFVLSHPSSIMS